MSTRQKIACASLLLLASLRCYASDASSNDNTLVNAPSTMRATPSGTPSGSTSHINMGDRYENSNYNHKLFDKPFITTSALAALAITGDLITTVIDTNKCQVETGSPYLYTKHPARHTTRVATVGAAELGISMLASALLRRFIPEQSRFHFMWRSPLVAETTSHVMGLQNNLRKCY